MADSIIIKLLDNSDNPLLKMKYVGAIDYATPKLGRDGKIRTGLDENSIDVLSIQDKTERTKVQNKIKKEREELETLLSVDLGPHSEFWTKFFIPLSDEEITLDPSNAIDRVREKFLVANRYVAPSLDAIYENEDFINCIFYLHRQEEETTKKAVKEKAKDKAIAKLFTLEENNPNKLKIVAAYIFGYHAESDISVDTAYTKLKEFIETADDTQRKRNIKAFIEAVDKTPEEMQTKITLDKAIRKKLVTQRNGIFRRGDKVLGNSYEEAVLNLSSVEWNSELSSLIKEVNKKE